MPGRAHGRSLRFLALTLATGALLAGCSGDAAAPGAGTEPPAGGRGTFARIQAEVFNAQCISCHRTGDPNARQSGLVLTADSSYAQLLGVASVQQIAKADGLRRVKAFKSDSSLLYHKLAWVPGHHSRDYGQLMPMGTAKGLTAGQLEYVRRWIEAGAPSTGHVVDTLVLADTRVQSATFTPLPPPGVGGLQLGVDSFAVTPTAERELFVYRRLNNATEVFVNRIQSRMRPGSHHLLLYTFDENKTSFPCNGRPMHDVMRDIRTVDGGYNVINMLPMACHVFFAGAMTPDFDYQFPAGIALRLPPNTSLDFNVHYVNRSPIPLPAQAFANLYFVNKSAVQTVAQTLNFANEDLTLPPNQRTTVRRAFSVNRRTTILALTSHMHSMGERFEVRVRRASGAETVVYTNTDWEHPVFTNYDTPIVLEPGDALVSNVTYNNVSTKTIRFGLSSDDEMDIIFGYWY
jgi:Copper type II ascorbate-dependent monooxygenase, C-terminal domain